MRVSSAETKVQAHIPRMLDWAALNCRLLWVYDARPDPFGRAGVYDHKHTKAWLVVKGAAEMEQGDRAVRAGPGQWLISTPGKHRQRFIEDTEILSVCFYAAWPDGASLFDEPHSRCLEAADHPAMTDLARRLLDVVSPLFPRALDYSLDNISLQTQSCDFPVFARVHQHFMLWLSSFYEAMKSAGAAQPRTGVDDARITRVLSLLDTWPLDKALERSYLGRAVNVTPKHLDRLFASVLGVTPVRYLERRRLRHVCQQLIESTTPIKEAAFDLGFHSEAHFSHWFKRNTGLSPRQFRERALSR